MKRLLFITLILLSSEFIIPQAKLTLEDCYEKARVNYPLIKQKDYIEKTKEYSVSNVWNGYFPQITIHGQATYQSDVTQVPSLLPGIIIQRLSKDQYKVVADVTQTIYDGGIMSSQAGIQGSVSEIDNQKIEIDNKQPICYYCAYENSRMHKGRRFKSIPKMVQQLKPNCCCKNNCCKSAIRIRKHF